MVPLPNHVYNYYVELISVDSATPACHSSIGLEWDLLAG